MISVEGKIQLNSEIGVESVAEIFDIGKHHDVYVDENNIYIKAEEKYIGPLVFNFDSVKQMSYLELKLSDEEIEISEDDIYKVN